ARAFDAALAVLVVACPCAFALTAPAAFTRALTALARRGVLVTDATALTRLAQVDIALFDKTGTLGVPRLELTGIEPLRGDSREEVLALATALARESSHPLAGAGLRGTVDGRALRLGRADFALGHALAIERQRDALLLADADGAIAAFRLAERPRHDAQATLDALRTDGIAPCIASGDTPERVAALAQVLGIADWRARQSPDDKLARLRELRAAGHVVLAVGDG